MEIDLELTCRGFKLDKEDVEVDGVDPDVNGARVLEVNLGVVVDDGIAFGIEVGIVTGQNDQSLLT